MRPEVLFPLFAPVRSLPGIGPRLEKLVERLSGPKIIDLLWHLPSGLIDRRNRPTIAQTHDGDVATIEVTGGLHIPPRTKRLPYRVHAFDDAKPDYILKILPEGERRIVSGRVEFYQGEPQMTHPDHIVALDEIESLPLLEPVYPLTAGLPLKSIQKALRATIPRLPELPEWQDASWLKAQGWSAWRPSLAAAHEPHALADLEPDAPARARLAYDELLASQLALGLIRLRMRRLPGRSVAGDGHLREKVAAALPFDLTGAQQRSLAEIFADMKSKHRMLRLLQGDVGSGKTVVAFLAMLNAVEAGFQAAMMAPTEILARQHHAMLAPFCEAAGVRVELLSGREKGKRREDILAAAAAGDIDILVGTHALFQDDVAFEALALAVVDEQHRFGVHQRLMLTAKGGTGIDVLVMTATPIPRTLTLTAYGDMDVSKLDEKPPGRMPIDTRALPLDRLGEVVARLDRALARGSAPSWKNPMRLTQQRLNRDTATCMRLSVTGWVLFTGA